MSLSTFISEFSPIPGGIGLVEVTMVLVYNALGLDLNIAIVAALLSRFIVYIQDLFIGGLSLFYLEAHFLKKK